MYLIDTNVISETRKISAGKADPNVARWAFETPSGENFISVITVHEIVKGIKLLAKRDPLRAEILERWLEETVIREFNGRILAIDEKIARIAGALHVPDPRPQLDALIAATALVHSLTLATRNTADFEPMGVKVFNPWTG